MICLHEPRSPRTNYYAAVHSRPYSYLCSGSRGIGLVGCGFIHGDREGRIRAELGVESRQQAACRQGSATNVAAGTSRAKVAFGGRDDLKTSSQSQCHANARYYNFFYTGWCDQLCQPNSFSGGQYYRTFTNELQRPNRQRAGASEI